MQEQSNTRFILPDSTKQEMANLARWSKYIAVSGLVIGGIIIIFGVFTGLIALGLFHLGISNEALANLPSWGLISIYIVVIGAYFIPFILLYNFSVKARAAIVMDSEKMLNRALNNLHQCFKFVGVITVSFLGIYVLSRIGIGIAYITGLL